MGQWAKKGRGLGEETQFKKMGEKGREACEVKEGHVWGVRGARAVPRPHL